MLSEMKTSVKFKHSCDLRKFDMKDGSQKMLTVNKLNYYGEESGVEIEK